VGSKDKRHASHLSESSEAAQRARTFVVWVPEKKRGLGHGEFVKWGTSSRSVHTQPRLIRVLAPHKTVTCRAGEIRIRMERAGSGETHDRGPALWACFVRIVGARGPPQTGTSMTVRQGVLGRRAGVVFLVVVQREPTPD
jgi:hypothetical protein